VLNKIEQSNVVEKIDGFTITDNPLAKMKYGSLFGAIRIQERFQKPVIATVSMRDRNRIALQSDLLGANDFGVRGILALTGDSANMSDQPNSKGVFEGDSTLLLDIIDAFNNGIDFSGKELSYKPRHIYPFAVINSFAKNPKTLFKKMKKKMEHGAVGIISQPVYNIEQAKKLLDIFEKAKAESGNHSCRLVLGFFPLVRFRTARFLASHVPGISVPTKWLDSLRLGLENGNEEEIGLQMSRKLFEDLLSLHGKIHIMSANNFNLVRELIQNG
jgi:5,10-methylenetetrahydrofolate reductase